jgi:hypothetical protein
MRIIFWQQRQRIILSAAGGGCAGAGLKAGLARLFKNKNIGKSLWYDILKKLNYSYWWQWHC